ncbi:RDD family protein [Gracilibacillus alcaliphilus]|uniref:RDD family protein n=1 Tax=Gracilibacillus alcaliphilus TaxID=1401441 RepID=UPI00195C0C1F|nr:RDD family protein [Gracilibacillus alcaliphilus]MBM7677780.1 putative RDD family membrane protein YckC [Gracilibacillus alcaliphilus]
MEQEQLQVKTPEYVSLEFKLAGLGSRSAAYLVDYCILFVVQMILIMIVFFSISFSNDSFFFFDIDTMNFILVFFLIAMFVLNFGYFVFLEFFWGGKTIGKKLLGIRVIQENGHNITFLSSLIRNFLRLIDMLPTMYAVGVIMIFSHPKHKRLGDLAAGTIVVHERGKKSSKKDPVTKYIEARNLYKEDLPLEAFDLQQFNQQDWQLLQAYVQRLTTLPPQEKPALTQQVSEVLLPGIESKLTQARSNETWLLLLYLHLKEEWEY